MSIENVIEYALSKPCNFPGKQNNPTVRTNPNQKSLEPKAQMLIVWRAFITYLNNQLQEGRSVNIRKFGAFVYDIETELPKISYGRSVNINHDVHTERAQRKHVHHLKPRFVPDDKIQYHLNRYHGKEQITPAGSQKSIYQKGFRTIYANSVPVAAACQMGKDVVDDALETIFTAIEDLIRLDKDINLQMGFCAMKFTNRKLTVHFAPNLSKGLADKDFETRMRRTNSPVANFWQTNTQKMFAQSDMGKLVSKPNKHVTEAMAQKTAALKLMSMDMSSAAKQPFRM